MSDTRPTIEALRAHRELTSVLHEWAPTVHRLVRERLALLEEAYGSYNHPLETLSEFTERVLAQGQYPFPVGECLFDDLNNNTSYELVEVGYALPEDGEALITYTGWYPRWAPDYESYEHRHATIHCPSWVVTDPDGEQRFRDRTAEMVTAVKAEREQQRARIDDLIEQALRERGNRP